MLYAIDIHYSNILYKVILMYGYLPLHTGDDVTQLCIQTKCRRLFKFGIHHHSARILLMWLKLWYKYLSILCYTRDTSLFHRVQLKQLNVYYRRLSHYCSMLVGAPTLDESLAGDRRDWVLIMNISVSRHWRQNAQKWTAYSVLPGTPMYRHNVVVTNFAKP